ncbi:hypothetical protein QTP86_034349, partial [Hemibagrus guttatus]
MATQLQGGIPLSAVCPRYLNTISTSHTGPFSAIAELIDNAYDPDVSAKQFWIDKTVIKGQDCLIFMDNGKGMDYDKMHKMLSLFLNLSFSPSVAQKYEECLHDILTHSLFNTKEELLNDFSAINGLCSTNSNGTRIIIWNLHKTSSGTLEFDFKKDRYDIRLPVDINDGNKEPEIEYSLRAYSSILYLKPRMQIIVCGKKVKTQLVSKSLAHIIKDTYKPTFLWSISEHILTLGPRKTIQNVSTKLEEYWKEIRHRHHKIHCTGPVEDDVEKNQKLQKEKNRQQSPVQGTPNSPSQRHAGSTSTQVPAPSPTSTRKKRPMGPSQKDGEMKRARIGNNFDSSTPSRPSTSTASSESLPILDNFENSDEIRRDGQTSVKLENSVLDVMEAQEQQDKLLELLEGVTNERDESQAQLLILNLQVEELRSQLLELTQKMLKKEYSHQYTQTSPEEAQDYKVLYLQGKEEIKQLQEELSWPKMEKEEGERKGQQSVLEYDELCCQTDFLLKEIDSRNKEREELKVKHSAATDVFTPELVQHCAASGAYRFLCSNAGVFSCKMTNISFDMKRSGEVLYTVESWDNSQLQGMGQFKPAGPLYNIDCSEDSILYLHLPHCEIHTGKNKLELAVAHISEDNVEIIQPLNITSTHVIFEVHGLSIFGLLKKWIFSENPISAQVLLFYKEIIGKERWRKLHIHLLPGNVPVDKVQEKHQSNTYIQCSSLCQLIPGKKYRPLCEPYVSQPKVETFVCDFGPNYHSTFEVILNTEVENLTLGLLDETGQEAWEPRQVFLTDESREAVPVEMNEGAAFVDKHRDTLIQRVLPLLEIADTLLTKKHITSEMYN